MSGQLDAFLKGSSPEDGGGSPRLSRSRRARNYGRRQMSLGPRIQAPVQHRLAPPRPCRRRPQPDDDPEPGEAEPGQPVVPRRAYETERQKRQNWVERASKAEAERDMLAKQLEEARKAPPPVTTPPQALEPIDPARDPEGYTRRVRGVVLNERLNTSEMLALEKHGKEDDRTPRPNTSNGERKPTRGCGTSFTPNRTRTNG